MYYLDDSPSSPVFDEDFWDPFDDREPQEDPTCYACCDTGQVRAPWPVRLFHRRVGCPGCNGNRATRYLFPAWPYRVRQWLRWGRRSLTNDEPPF